MTVRLEVLSDVFRIQTHAERSSRVPHGGLMIIKQGMEHQMISLANLGLLGNFVGMLTDSRSFLSYPRHEYFRRIMCNIIGEWVENGEYPYDLKNLENIVKGISYNNAVKYFGFNLQV